MINYYLLTKPGIIFGNLVTLAAGFMLAANGSIDWLLFFSTLLGLALIVASACVFNNYIDRNIDRKMERTRNRPSATGVISLFNAMLFALLLAIFGTAILLYFTNLLTVAIAEFGLFVYVIPYSFWKRRTVYGTAIGSVAGAVPPVIGYCAISNSFDLGSLILFAMMMFWQMPHFFSIAVFRLEEYAAAEIPVLPIEKGLMRAKIHMSLYIIGFIAAGAALTAARYTGLLYLAITTILGFVWLFLSLKGFNTQNDHKWGRQMFIASLFIIMSTCLMISFDTL